MILRVSLRGGGYLVDRNYVGDVVEKNSPKTELFIYGYSAIMTALVGVYAVALCLSPYTSVMNLLDSCAKVLGPVLAAFIAWLGVNHTVRNSRRTESLKEWHANLRWASELSSSSKDHDIALAIAVLDSLDNEPMLGPSEQSIIDAVLAAVIDDDV